MRPSINPFDTFNFTMKFISSTDFAGNVVKAQAGVANARSELVLLSFSLTTDATVAFRLPRLTFNDPVLTATFIIPHMVCPASSTYHYLFAQGLTQYGATGHTYFTAPLPSGVFLLQDWFHRINIDNGVAGDLVSNIRLLYKVWPFDQ